MAKVIVLLPERRKRRQDTDLRLPKVVTDLAMAEQFQRLLDAGTVRTRAELARGFRLTRARVTQLMDLLKLQPEILAYLKSLPSGTPTKRITERSLRSLTRLSFDEQLRVAYSAFPGFLAQCSSVIM